jgi:hypothetical protein
MQIDVNNEYFKNIAPLISRLHKQDEEMLEGNEQDDESVR